MKNCIFCDVHISIGLIFSYVHRRFIWKTTSCAEINGEQGGIAGFSISAEHFWCSQKNCGKNEKFSNFTFSQVHNFWLHQPKRKRKAPSDAENDVEQDGIFGFFIRHSFLMQTKKLQKIEKFSNFTFSHVHNFWLDQRKWKRKMPSDAENDVEQDGIIGFLIRHRFFHFQVKKSKKMKNRSILLW